MRDITGYDAIRLMREISRKDDGEFTLIHLTADLTNWESYGFKRVERCRLRKSINYNTFHIDSEHYLPYTDLDTDEYKMCFRWLVRYIALPPDYNLIKVNWLK